MSQSLVDALKNRSTKVIANMLHGFAEEYRYDIIDSIARSMSIEEFIEALERALREARGLIEDRKKRNEPAPVLPSAEDIREAIGYFEKFSRSYAAALAALALSSYVPIKERE